MLKHRGVGGQDRFVRRDFAEHRLLDRQGLFSEPRDQPGEDVSLDPTRSTKPVEFR
jgi:hypothetical protein